MHIDLLARPAAAAARIRLDPGETVICEVGSMIAMTSGIGVQTTSRSRGGGLLRGIRRMFAGESFFLNHFTARTANQEIIIGPDLVGDIVQHRLQGGSIIVQGQSWLASSTDVEIDSTWQGLTSSLFSGEHMFWVKCSGTGEVLLNSYGGIYEVDIRDSYTVDTGHIVAFEDTLKFRIGRASDSILGSFLGGEGFVCKFSGQGKLYCQTHNAVSFGKLLGPELKARQA